VLVADHLAPGPGVGRADLGRALPHAEQALAAGSQAGHRPPILSACGFRNTTHRFTNPRPTAKPAAASGTRPGTACRDFKRSEVQRQRCGSGARPAAILGPWRVVSSRPTRIDPRSPRTTRQLKRLV